MSDALHRFQNASDAPPPGAQNVAEKQEILRSSELSEFSTAGTNLKPEQTNDTKKTGLIGTAQSPMLKASKQSVDYSRGHAGAHCGKVLDDDKAPGFDELKNKVELPGAILRWAVAKLGRRGRRREGVGIAKRDCGRSIGRGVS